MGDAARVMGMKTEEIARAVWPFPLLLTVAEKSAWSEVWRLAGEVGLFPSRTVDRQLVR